jgi:TetR/AcrR family transcriptional regulator, regulator of cefoperazone and chloramphenicol sensitivity
VTEPRPASRRGTATRTAIVAAAAECISELGMSRTSSREIIRRTGFTWGVIQHHFGTYNAVLLAVVESASSGLRDMLSELKPDETASTRQRVAAVADVVWDYFQRADYLGYLEIYLHLLRDPEASDQVRAALRAFDVDVETVWASAMRRLFGEAIVDAAFQRILFATMRGLAVSRWLNEGRLDFAGERQIFVDMLAEYVDGSALQ